MGIRINQSFGVTSYVRGAAFTSPVTKTGLNEHGFPVDDGRPYSRSNRRSQVRRHYVGLRFHELQNTNISLIIANCVDFRTASERVCRSKVSTTMDIYSHTLPKNDSEVPDLIGKS